MRYPKENHSLSHRQVTGERLAHDMTEQCNRYMPASKAAAWLQRGATLGRLLNSWRKRPDNPGKVSGPAVQP